MIPIILKIIPGKIYLGPLDEDESDDLDLLEDDGDDEWDLDDDEEEDNSTEVGARNKREPLSKTTQEASILRTQALPGPQLETILWQKTILW